MAPGCRCRALGAHFGDSARNASAGPTASSLPGSLSLAPLGLVDIPDPTHGLRGCILSPRCGWDRRVCIQTRNPLTFGSSSCTDGLWGTPGSASRLQAITSQWSMSYLPIGRWANDFSTLVLLGGSTYNPTKNRKLGRSSGEACAEGAGCFLRHH
jgi:hypothetical protein